MKHCMISLLLAAILKKWPDTEFISSEQLYYIMREQ